MINKARLALMAAVAAVSVVSPALARMGSVGIMGDNYSIMAPERASRVQTPEPWLAPTYKSPRGTGRTFQNLPTLSGSGPGGTETFQDRAARCAHQAGVYGQATTGSYMGACVN
jgi:hypothetical protein